MVASRPGEAVVVHTHVYVYVGGPGGVMFCCKMIIVDSFFFSSGKQLIVISDRSVKT